MREILLTSSVLILAVLLLRLVFRDRISRRVQYALWALVLLRLLVPVSLPGADFSVLSAAEPVGQAVAERLEAQLAPAPSGETAPPVTVLPDVTENAPAESPEAALPAAGAGAGTIAPDAGGGTAAGPARTLTAAEVLTAVWLTGAAAMAVWFLVSNLRFWRKLRRTRTPYAVDGCAYPVYLVEAGLPSPCLFGLVRPAVYLTSAAVETPERLRHVIAHETAHAHHLDPLWSLLRCVCLAVYWFDPLVWIAAYVSKADGELACDEAAIRALGEAERIPYGRTLLALIPVRRGPGSPLLSATTMTAGKRQLTERITRIARGSQTRAAALFLVLALAALACAVTFTGAKGDGATGGGEPRPLTGDELAYFNETFFNQHGAYTIRNQFLNSLYERPEDIDLFELFYCGTGIDEIMTDEELRQVGSFDTEGGLICPVDKMSVEAINQVLLENTGLTLDETEQIGMESFQYLPEYNAYYHSHGDTNYWGDVFISAGEREGGTIRLYYWDNFARYDCDWLCLTLEVQADGRCWFVSNQPSEKPSIPTAYPETDPVLTISLTDLEPLAMEPVTFTERRDDCQQVYYTLGANDRTYCLYQSTDGNIYGAEILEDTETSWRASCFLTVEYDAWEDVLDLQAFSDTLGLDGFYAAYNVAMGTQNYDYYTWDASGNLLHLLHTNSAPSSVDMDGDGQDELLWTPVAPADPDDQGTTYLVFSRDGVLYQANTKRLLAENWPEMDFWDYCTIDVSRRCLTIVGMVQDPEGGTPYHFTRYLYFDGENILVYQDNTTYTDHVADNINVPEAVLSAAKDAVLSDLDYWRTHTGAMAYVDGQWQQTGTPAEWDDWRITELALADTVPAYPELGLRVYHLGHELHTTTPENVMLAGGMYLDEDGWMGGSNSMSHILVFHTMADSGPALLQSSIPNDVGRTSDSPIFCALMAQVALENGLLTPSEVRPVDLYYLFYNNQGVFLNLIGAFPVEEQNAALDAMAEYAVSVADTDDGGLLADGLQRLEEYDGLYELTEEGEAAHRRLQSAWTRAQAEAERQSLLAGQAQGEGTVYETGGLTLWVPENWADMAVVTAKDAAAGAGFAVYERLAYESGLNPGLVWSLSVYTTAQFQSAFGDPDWSEILGASSYVIGSDDAHVYLLTTPTDVQFLEDDPASMARYGILRDQSQTVIEGFLFRNGVTPNPDCPDADGCYVGPGSSGRPAAYFAQHPGSS